MISRTIIMTSKDKDLLSAFTDWAMDTEGMEFTIVQHENKWAAISNTRYDPQVVSALKRMFKEEYSMF